MGQFLNILGCPWIILLIESQGFNCISFISFWVKYSEAKQRKVAVSIEYIPNGMDRH